MDGWMDRPPHGFDLLSFACPKLNPAGHSLTPDLNATDSNHGRVVCQSINR